jgi:hypothetical protein
LEEDFDHLLQLREGEATARRGAAVSNNYSNSATHITSIIGNHQGLVRGPTWSGKLEHWKDVKLPGFLKSSPPRSITDSGELPFQEGRPLALSDGEEEGKVARTTKRFASDREVFMIQADGDGEGLERVQLDNYVDDYIYDPLDQGVDVTMSFDFSNTIKIEDADDVQMERRKIINAKQAKSRHHVVEMHQPGQSNPFDCSTGNLRTVIKVGRDTRNIIIARQQECEEVEAYSPTNYQIPINYLDTTWKRKSQVGEQSIRRKKTLSSKERFEESLNKRCLWHPKSKHSTFECQTLRRALGAPPLNVDCEEKRRDCPNNDLFINLYPIEGDF